MTRTSAPGRKGRVRGTPHPDCPPSAATGPGRRLPRPHRPLLVVVLLLLLAAPSARAYRTGDPVGLLIRGPGGDRDALRSQMPLFGMDTSASISVELVGGGRGAGVSLAFGSDGGEAGSLPWIEVGGGGGARRTLRSLEVTFVHEGGEVRSVSHVATYAAAADEGGEGAAAAARFAVRYRWVREADVDAGVGLWAMFAAVLAASMALLAGACGTMAHEIADAEGEGEGEGDGDGGPLARGIPVESWPGGGGGAYGARADTSKWQ